MLISTEPTRPLRTRKFWKSSLDTESPKHCSQSRLLIVLTHPSAASEALRRQVSVAYDTARGANSWEAQHQQRLMSRKFLPHSLVLRASWTIRSVELKLYNKI